MPFTKRTIKLGDREESLYTGEFFDVNLEAKDWGGAELVEMEIDFKFDAELRRVPFTASQQTEDRGGDVVKVGGGDLKDYKRNPVMMPFHEYNRFPLGIVPALRRDGEDLRGVAQFSRMPEYLDATIAFGLYAEKVMRGFSIGFLETVTRLLKQEAAAEKEEGNLVWRFPGRSFDRWKLLEISAAPVPAHANALADGNLKDAQYLASRMAEAIVGHSRAILDADSADRVVRRFIEILNESAAPEDGRQADVPRVPASPPEAESGPRERSTTIPESEREEITRAAADYVLARL